MNIDWNDIAEKLKLDLSNLIVNVIGILFILLLARIFLNMLTKFTTKVIARSKKIDDESRCVLSG